MTPFVQANEAGPRRNQTLAIARAASIGLGVATICTLLCATADAVFAKSATPKVQSRRYNLVFILADDVGYSDTTLYGTTWLYETPNIQRLAGRGMLFANAYSASPICSPTRASIMSGQEPGRLGFTSATGQVKRIATTSHFSVPGEVRKRRANLELRKATIARSATRMAGEVLTLAEALGRAGYATGHFGKWHLGSEPYSPLEQGFDVDIPHWSGGGPPGSYIAPWNFPKESKFTARSPSEHLEDRMVQEAIAFMKQHKDRPFFLNYWAFSTHTPLNAKRELVDKYAEKVHRSNPQHNPVYAAMVESFDEAVGKLLDAVDELGVAERTIIVFYSDNGGSTYAHSNGVPATSNAPLRGGKSSIYEGGIKVPAAVIWPGHIDPGSKSDAFLSSADWYPTLLEMLEIEKTSGQLFDGVSQVPAFLGKSAPRSSIYSFFPHYTPRTGTIPATSIRKEHWKLIRFHHAGDKQEDRFELYNLDDDIGESKNLAEVYPDRVESLNNEISSYLRNIGALVPVPNANYKHAEDR